MKPALVQALLALVLPVVSTSGDDKAAPVPPAVVQLAESFLNSLQGSARPKNRDEAREQFSASFLLGFTSPGARFLCDSPIERSGFAAGQAYWLEHPGDRDAIFAGYGYEHTDTVGSWIQAFEVSAFSPVPPRGGQWWLEWLGDALEGIPLSDDLTRSSRKLRVRVVGYLSPPGQYGHMGAYARKLIAVRVKPVAD